MEIVSVLLHLIGLAFLLFLSAFFSGSETALFSLSKTQVERLRQGPARNGMIAARLLDTPRRLLITILVGNMFVNVASATLVASFATALLGSKGVGIAAGITTILLLIFGEVTPKTIAVHNAERISKLIAYPIRLFSIIIFPLRVALRFVTNALMQLMGSGTVPVEDRLTTEELRVMVEMAEEGGSIKKQEKEMLNTIFDLRDITAAEIMTPRTEMVCASEESTMQQVFDLAHTTGRSRIPVYKDDIDHISGIAHIRDLPLWRHQHVYGMTVREFSEKSQVLQPSRKGTLIRPPILIPETRSAMGLIQDFHDRGAHIAILLDEYGGTAGLVTMEDLIEELVGEIGNEDDTASEEFKSLDDSTTLVSGGISIRNVNKKLGLNILVEEDEDIDTIGGYVLHLFGRIPEPNEVFHDDNLVFRVLEVDKQRITRIEIRKISADKK